MLHKDSVKLSNSGLIVDESAPLQIKNFPSSKYLCVLQISHFIFNLSESSLLVSVTTKLPEVFAFFFKVPHFSQPSIGNFGTHNIKMKMKNILS
jgi:hypothetical protein